VSYSTDLHVVQAPMRTRTSHLQDPDHPYVDGVWLPVLGPASYVAWRHLARLAIRSSRATISLDALAAATGLGAPRGQQSPLSRTLRRLDRFDLAHVRDDHILVRTALPFVTGRQLARLRSHHPGHPPCAPRWHRPHRLLTALGSPPKRGTRRRLPLPRPIS
jgi:hypothetical protein